MVRLHYLRDSAGLLYIVSPSTMSIDSEELVHDKVLIFDSSLNSTGLQIIVGLETPGIMITSSS